MKVMELNKYIKRLISYDPILNSVLVEGELSNFKLHSSGHAYFSLKDNNSKINCVMFRSAYSTVDFIPTDGMKVQISGNISIYERDGKYQLYADTITLVGTGDLYYKFQLLKEELKLNGYFDKSLKIPKYPKKIGIITSPTGAAVRDILTVLNRRNKNIDIVIYPVHVQGDKAKLEISTAIEYFNEYKTVDIIILSRGGGSLEELWAFNELIVAESIFESKIPIISGVGHETDFTISDFVSDLRAATPSEAAELAVASFEVIKKELVELNLELVKSINRYINFKKLELENYSVNRINKLINRDLDNLVYVLAELGKNLSKNMANYINETKNNLDILVNKLDMISPLNTLKRGYAIVQKNGENVVSIESVEKTDLIDILVENGIIKTEVISTERNSIYGKEKR